MRIYNLPGCFVSPFALAALPAADGATESYFSSLNANLRRITLQLNFLCLQILTQSLVYVKLTT